MSKISISEQREFYNQRWDDFEYANRLKLVRAVAILDALRKTKLYQPKMLDLGCGSGWLTNILSAFGPTTGVDLSDKAIEKAKVRFPNTNFFAQNIMELEGHEDFDVVISQEVIEHLISPENYLRIARSFIKPGGYLILTTPNPKTFAAMDLTQSEGWSDQPIEDLISITSLKKMIGQGFKLISIRTIIPGYGSRGIYRIVNSMRLRSLVEKLIGIRIYEALIESMGYGLHTIAVARKAVVFDR